MGTINEFVSGVRLLLLNPKSQAPTLEQCLHAICLEGSDFINELENTDLPWTHETEDIILIDGQSDYLLTHTGKPLFVASYPQDSNFPPHLVEFADLAHVTTDYWLFSPLDAGYFRDFNENWWNGTSFEAAFFRQGASLYLRVAPHIQTSARLVVTLSTGDWINNINVESSAVLSNHHGLIQTRAAKNLLPACEWKTPEADDILRRNLSISFSEQIERKEQNFMLAKRSLHADHANVRSGYGDSY